MLHYRISRILLCTSLFLLTILLPSCKKDSTTSVPKRLSRLNYLWNNAPGRALTYYYKYTGNQVSEILFYDEADTSTHDPLSKTVFDYQGDWITASTFSFEGGAWVLHYENHYHDSAGMILEWSYIPIINATSEAANRYTYDYSGTTIIRETEYYAWSFDPWYPDHKSEFIYENGLLTAIMEYNDSKGKGWVPSAKTEVRYNGNRISEQVVYYATDTGFVEQYRLPYEYSGDQITSIGLGTLQPESFLYNSDGDLSTYTDDNQFFATKTYEYEDGTGNAARITYLKNPRKKLLQHPTVCNVR